MKMMISENLYLLPLTGSAVTSHAVAANEWELYTEAPVLQLAHQGHVAAGDTHGATQALRPFYTHG